METAFEWRLMENMTLTLPYVSARHTFTDPTPEKATSVPAWNMILGARLSFDLFPVGE
jgi:hypothetical protein